MAKRMIRDRKFKREKKSRVSRTEEYMVNLKYLGDEPRYNGETLTDLQLSTAYTWYSYMCSASDARGYIIVPDVAKIRAAVTEAFSAQPTKEEREADAIAREAARIWVLNGTGRKGEAGTLAAALGRAGLDASAPTTIVPDEIVVTGVGPISPVGTGREAYAAGLFADVLSLNLRQFVLLSERYHGRRRQSATSADSTAVFNEMRLKNPEQAEGLLSIVKARHASIKARAKKGDRWALNLLAKLGVRATPKPGENGHN